MTYSPSLEDLSTQNDRALRTLSRTINLTSGRRFELIIVRCNYSSLQSQMMQRLREECSVEIQELRLSPSAQTLYTQIETRFSDEPPPALCVLGLESVVHLDELLLSTNQVREEFRKKFKFPLVLWVNDRILEKLIRLVPDFHNWATPISFFFPHLN